MNRMYYLFFCESKKSSLSDYLDGFRVRSHTFICLYETWKRLWVIRDTILFQKCTRVTWTHVRKEVVTHSLTRFLLVDDRCRHVKRKRHGVIWTCVYTQETNRDLRRKDLFWTRHTTSVVSVSWMSKDIPGLGVHETWKLLSPNRGCEKIFIYSTSSRVRSHSYNRWYIITKWMSGETPGGIFT